MDDDPVRADARERALAGAIGRCGRCGRRVVQARHFTTDAPAALHVMDAGPWVLNVEPTPNGDRVVFREFVIEDRIRDPYLIRYEFHAKECRP